MGNLRAKAGLVVGLCLLAFSAAAQDKPPGGAETQFQQGFYLQVHQHDLAGAAVLFEKVVGDASASESLRAEAKTRLAQVREDLASIDFAHLMPRDVLAYAELVEPGEHIARILKMVGLLNAPTGVAVQRPPGAEPALEKPIPLGNGLYLPADFSISPALVGEIKKIRGAAVGLTALDQRGRPSGLVAIHPGDCDLLRGVIETAVQVLEPGESIEGFKTYRVPDLGWVMLTARLVLASESREQLASAVQRLRSPEAESLASRAEFQRVQSQSKGALLFAFVDGPQIVKRYGSELRGQDGAMIRALLDVEHLESFVVALGTTDNSVQLRAQLNMMPGHHNLLYALIRTAPVTKRSLSQVPQGSAGVVLLGLNPAGAAAPEEGSDQNPPNVSAMDIGRELFNNIEEVAVFALPASDGPLPEMGVVIAVKDPAKSEALWNQVLSVAAMFGARTVQQPAEVSIEGHAGHTYQFQGVPPIVVVRSQERTLLIGTHGAVTASLHATSTKTSITQDPVFAPLLERLTPDTSKAVLVDVGRALDIVSAMSKGREAQDLKMVGAMTRDLKVSLVTDEGPNQLTVRLEATGLPNVPTILSLINQGQGERRKATANK